jgi:hypothetical protein
MTSPPRSRIAVPLPGPDAELLTAICTICDGQPTRADFDRIERMLQDPAAMTVYLAVTDLDASLRWKLRGHTPWHVPTDNRGRPPGHHAARQPKAAVPAPQTLTRRRAVPGQAAPPISAPAPSRWQRPAGFGSALRRVAMVGVAVLIAATINGGIKYVSVKKSPTPTVAPLPRLPGSVACVTSLHGVARSVNDGASAASVPLDLFASLFPGQRITIDRGLVELAFDSGARAILDGPIACEITSASVVRLDRGRLTATVSKQSGAVAGPRLIVETPTATVTDIGTSFGVAVDEAGLTDVTVFDGLVDLLPRLSGEAGGSGASAAVRLATGEAAALTSPGKVSRHSPRGTIQFKRSMPKGAPSAPAGPSPVPWAAARATAIYRDALKGSGQLAGSSPSRRSGTGAAAWTAPPAGWELTGAGLVATSRGKASLPFAPQPGRIYRLEATVNVTAGGDDWAAIGFSSAAAPQDPAMTAAWILQRHSTALDPNLMFFGSDAQNLRIIKGDSVTGRRTLVILLDTTQTQWTVTFLADGRPLGGNVLPAHARIEAVCLACQGQAHVSCDDLSLLVKEVVR